jgi:hypothetical protein
VIAEIYGSIAQMIGVADQGARLCLVGLMPDGQISKNLSSPI